MCVLSTEHSLITKSNGPSRDQALGVGLLLYMEEYSVPCAGGSGMTYCRWSVQLGVRMSTLTTHSDHGTQHLL